MIKVIYFCSLLILLSACGGSDTGNKGGSDSGVSEFGVAELGYNPQTRWPEKGDYSYSFDYSYNGSRCVAKKSFRSEAGYCLGLQDQTLNQGCALPARRQAYQKDCGSDFQELNFRADFSRSGFDSRLQRACSTGSPQSSVFKSVRAFCGFLADESLHQNCFWDERAAQFRDLRCPGVFSTEPPVHVPPPPAAPTPAPTPTPTPTPTPDPLDQIKVVRTLRAAGIQVEINWRAIRDLTNHRYPLPGTPSLDEQMRLFWAELAANESALLDRKGLISKLTVTIYTNYRKASSPKGDLSLDFETPQGLFKTYFPLFDEMIKVYRLAGIEMEFIHSGQDLRAPYAPLETVLAELRNQWSEVQTLKGILRKIDLDTFSSFYPDGGELTLKRDHIATELKRYIGLLKPLAPVYRWADQNKVEIEARYDLEKDAVNVDRAFSLVEKNLSQLSLLVTAGKLRTLGIDFYTLDGRIISYWDGIQTLHLSVDTKSASQIPAYLNALAYVAKYSTEFRRPIEVEQKDLDPKFLSAVGHLQALAPKIRTKLGKIQEISISWESKYWQSLKLLKIGGESTLKETERVIDSL